MARVGNGAALEQSHVHQVYDQIAPCFAEISQKAWPNVRKFLKEQTPGSLIADVGCGSGRYLHINNKVFKLGLDICCPLVEFARTKNYDVIVADNLKLPYRDNIFDAVISIGVIHHFSSHERRVHAVQELCRVLRPGGQLMIYVWSYEQKHRRFDGQDVLIPWNGKRKYSVSGNLSRGSSYSDRDLSSTGSVSEDDVSMETESSTHSFQQFGRSLSDPFENGNSVEDDVDVFVKKTMEIGGVNKRLTNRHRSNTLPSTLYGYFHRADSSFKHSKDSDVVKECRKLEASLKALSASQHRFSSSDTLEFEDFEMKENLRYDLNSNKESKVSFDIGSSDVLNSTSDYDREYQDKTRTGLIDKNDQNGCQYLVDKNFQNGFQDLVDKDFQNGHQDLSNLTSSAHDLNKLNSSDKDKLTSSTNHKCSGSRPNRPTSIDLLPNYCYHDNSKEKQKSVKSSKTAKNKQKSLFESIRDNVLGLFGGKSKEKPVKNISEYNNINSGLDFDKLEKYEIHPGYEEFKVREFPLSSCPMNNEELLANKGSRDSMEKGNVCHQNTHMESTDQSPDKQVKEKHEYKTDIQYSYTKDKNTEQRSNETLSKAFVKSMKSKSEKDFTQNSSEYNTMQHISCRDETISNVFPKSMKSNSEKDFAQNIESALCKDHLLSGVKTVNGHERSKKYNGQSCEKSYNFVDEYSKDVGKEHYKNFRISKMVKVPLNDEYRNKDKTKCVTDSETSNDTKVRVSHDTKASLSCDTKVKMPHNIKDELSHDTKLEALHDTKVESSHDTKVDSSHDFKVKDKNGGKVNGYISSQTMCSGVKSKHGSITDDICSKKSTHLCRYYHVFKEGELNDLILQNIPQVKIIKSCYDHSNWCVIVEKIH